MHKTIIRAGHIRKGGGDTACASWEGGDRTVQSTQEFSFDSETKGSGGLLGVLGRLSEGGCFSPSSHGRVSVRRLCLSWDACR